MMTDAVGAAATIAASRDERSDRAAVVAVLGLLIGLRVWFMFGTAPIGDEAYYWLWGQSLDLSYFDHPPLTAWLQSVSAALFGWTRFSLRLLSLVTTGATIWLLYLWARYLGGRAWQRYLALSVLILFASPLFFTFTAMVYPDQLLIALILGASYCLVRFFDSWDAAAPRWRLLFGGAALLGLAALAKYNAVFLAAGFAACIVLMPSKRRLLLAPQLYLAGLLTLVILSPIVIWNLQHGGASMKFNLIDRHGDFFGAESLGNLALFVLQNVIYLSIFLVWPVLKVVTGRAGAGLPDNASALGRAAFLISTATMAFVSLSGGAGAYWNVVAYVPLLPLLAAVMGRAQLTLHATFGAVMIATFVFNGAALPLTALSGRYDWENAVLYGWDEIEAEFAKAEGEYQPDFLAASRYSLAAQLSFARGKADVTALAARNDQFDVWFDPAAHAGKSALILTDEGQPLSRYVTGHFDKVEEVSAFDITRFGYKLNRVRLYLATDYRP